MAANQKAIDIEVLRYRPEQENKPPLHACAVRDTNGVPVLRRLQVVKVTGDAHRYRLVLRRLPQTGRSRQRDQYA